MPVTPDNLRRLAEYLANAPFDDAGIGDEVQWRASISRAYYAFYLGVRRFLERKGNINYSREKDCHSQLIWDLRNVAVDELYLVRGLADSLQQAKRKRENADYDLDAEISQRDADALLADLRDGTRAFDQVTRRHGDALIAAVAKHRGKASIPSSPSNT